MKNTFAALPRPFFILAPMDDVTDTVFRQIVAWCAAPHLFFTEFVNVEGLQSAGRASLLKKLRFTPRELPLIAQIWGREPKNFYKTARELADGTFASELGLPPSINFAGVDLNMGCPDKTAVKHGTCSALINNRPLAEEIIQATQEGVAGRLPISVKTRLGFSSIDLTWLEFLLQQKLSMLTIHLRTRKEMSKVPAHWDVADQLHKLRTAVSPHTLLVGNGDVLNRAHGIELARAYNLDGIMIGRGIFHDPFAFDEDSPWPAMDKVQRIALFAKHIHTFAETWQSGERNIATLNKFCKIYISGFSEAKEMRERLMSANSISELITMLNEVRKAVMQKA